MNLEASISTPVEFTLENKTAINQTFRYFRINIVKTLKPAESIIITVTSSEELAYYTKIQTELENSSGNNEIILEFPDPLDIGEPLDDNILSHEYMLELIARSQENPLTVIITQSGVSFNATFEPTSENSCDLVVIDGDGDMLQYEVMQEDENIYGEVVGHNGMRAWNIMSPR